MITLESTVDEVDVESLQTKLKARNSLQVNLIRLQFLIRLYNLIVNLQFNVCFCLDC